MANEYDTISKLYDPLLYFALKPIRIAVMNELLQYKDKIILDLCCGTGNQLKLLSKNGFKHLHCLDLSNSMLDIARENHHLKIYNEDATKTSFKSETIDIIIISFAIHEKNMDTQKNILKEAHRLLKKDGLILIIDYDFTKKTPSFVKIGINLIERIAGKEHFNNFKAYITNSGLSSLINKNEFSLVNIKSKIFNSISISMYKKIF